MRLAVLGLTVLCGLAGPSPQAEPGSEAYLPLSADIPDREERQRCQTEIRAAMEATHRETEQAMQTDAPVNESLV